MRDAGLREQLLEAAELEIHESGLARASLRAIARRCTVTHQALAYYFSDRAGLLTALATKGFVLLGQQLEAAVATSTREGGKPVASIGIAYVRFAEAHATMFDVMNQSELLHASDEAFVAAKWRAWHLLVTEVIAAQSRGWAKHVPTETLALTCWSHTHGLAVIRRDAHNSPMIPEDLDYAQVIGVMTDALDMTKFPKL